jgi:hypothetical protein
MRSEVPVEMQGLHPTVVARVDGRPVRFVLDSGSFFSGISARFAAERKMRPARAAPLTGSPLYTDARAGCTGVAGGVRVSPMVRAEAFEFAGRSFGRASFVTLPMEAGGLLGQSVLGMADVDYDLGAGTVAMVEVRDCRKSTLAYWAVGRPYSMLPLDRRDRGQHTIATVLVNGKAMRAVFDTGAEASLITRRAAARAGMKVTAPEVKEAGVSYGLDRIPIRTWIARFASVKLVTEEVIGGVLAIGDTDSEDFDMLIGADFFLSHHVYVANSQGRVYFTHTRGPAFNPGARRGALAPPRR